MSRVEEEREAALLAARQAEARRAEEARGTGRAAADSAFKRLVTKGQDEAQTRDRAGTQREGLARSAIDLLRSTERDAAAEASAYAERAHGERAQGERHKDGAQRESAFQGRLVGQSGDARVAGQGRADGEAAQKTKLASDQGTAESTQSRAADRQGETRHTDGRRTDAREARERLAARREGSTEGGAGSQASTRRGGARGESGELKADADQQGGAGEQGKGDKDGPAGGMPGGFRLNPALQAPIPVAQKKDVSGSERLRKLASELSQKIVDRVRVGTNAAGRVEFQVDLRSDVLSGVKVRVSAHNGKVQAFFSGTDREVLKLIEGQGEALKSALAARGLTLEDFKVEAST